MELAWLPDVSLPFVLPFPLDVPLLCDPVPAPLPLPEPLEPDCCAMAAVAMPIERAHTAIIFVNIGFSSLLLSCSNSPAMKLFRNIRNLFLGNLLNPAPLTAVV
ncbi:hypothetical protein BSK43_015540 [Rhizobium sp. P44RR-XXIV]|nr:hypothetical protein BSK43_015540 [Rhizobium sp. P44RR-XXIV]